MAFTRTSWKWAYVILMVSAVFCSDSPKEAPVALALAVLAFCYLGLHWLVFGGRIAVNPTTIGLAVFFAAILISLPMALLNGVSPRDWLLRGSAALFFLGLYVLLPVRQDSDARFVLQVLVATSLIWAAKIGYHVFIDADAAQYRWTAITRDLLFPFNLVALCILLFERKSFPRIIRSVGILVFIVLTIGGGYRSQLLILALIFTVYFWRSLIQLRVLIPLFVVSIFAAGIAIFASTDGGAAVLGRFYEIADERNSARAKEIAFAFERFLESPIIGNGLAYPIPLEVTFYGRENYLEGIERQQSNYTHVTYMHNIAMYLLMSLGILGFLGYLVFVGGGLIQSRSRIFQSYLQGNSRRACWWALVSILLFTLTAATFTLFQFNLLVASLVALLASRRSSVAPTFCASAVDRTSVNLRRQS